MPRPNPTPRETAEQATARMFQDEDSWPNWPVLPIKKRDSTRPEDCGLLFTGGNVVYLKNLFDPTPIDDSTPKLEFADRDAIITAGWIVD